MFFTPQFSIYITIISDKLHARLVREFVDNWMPKLLAQKNECREFAFRKRLSIFENSFLEQFKAKSLESDIILCASINFRYKK